MLCNLISYYFHRIYFNVSDSSVHFEQTFTFGSLNPKLNLVLKILRKLQSINFYVELLGYEYEFGRNGYMNM